MRKALVCISLMLALVLVWSMIFGQHDEGAAAATVARIEAQSPVRRFAVSKVMPIPAKVGAPGAGCYRRYKMPPDTAQRRSDLSNSAADKWDLCEATGSGELTG